MPEERTRVETAPSAGPDPEWELFVREAPGEPLVYAGSLSAPTADAADELAGGLFDSPTDLWLCPADTVERFTSRARNPLPGSSQE
ncbi:MAG: Htur_1727 family rSAM-partnered candidate RiPP [Halobacteriaceae archaeon]